MNIQEDLAKANAKLKPELAKAEAQTDGLLTKLQGSRYSALITFLALQAAVALGYVLRGYIDIVIK